MILDDEPINRSTIYHWLIDANLQLNRIDVADSAHSARVLLKQNPYDIFLCDIVMPEEDGISFARWTLERYSSSKFIFLTAHTDFQYMKEAISMQSFDYILQPADKEDVIKDIQRAMVQISIEKKNLKLIETGTFFIDKAVDILDVNTMRYLLKLSSDSTYFDRLIQNQAGNWNPKNIQYIPTVVHVLSDDFSWKENDRALLRSIYYNIIGEIVAPIRTKNLVILKDNNGGDFIAIYMFFETSDQRPDNFISKMETIRLLFHKIVQMDIAIYCGDMVSRDHLADMCRKIIKEQDSNAKRESKVYKVGEITGLLTEKDELAQKLSSWRVLLNQNRILDFQSSFCLYLDICASRNDLNTNTLMILHQGVSEMLLNCMASLDIDSSKIFDDKFSYYDFMYCWKEIGELKRVIYETINRMEQLAVDNTEDAVQNTIQYIRKNIDSPLSVTDLAERVGLHADYLTRIFKKNTGVSIKRYIENERMETAKLLLKTTNLPVTIISERAGYASYSNFTKNFHRLIGITPTEFRDTCAS